MIDAAIHFARVMLDIVGAEKGLGGSTECLV